jgi:beta-RFAP synthase
MRGDLGRIHGSLGVAIERPRLRLEIKEAEENRIYGARSSRVEEIIDLFIRDYSIKSGVEVVIHEDIPEHTGFGSGTQLSLALGTAMNHIFKLGLTCRDIAIKLERSKVSGIGIYSFLQGGFIVDGGHQVEDQNTVPPLIFQSNFPKEWQFVVCIPKIKKGFSGDQEQNAFKKLKPPPRDVVDSVSRMVLMQMIPSIIDRNIKLFGDAITKLDTIFGDYWKEIQGGTYTHKRIEECVNHLLENKAYGAGQSSWGPALYGLTGGIEQANELKNEMKQFLNINGNTGDVFITRVDNNGARITKR